jgi:hypothetical protein
MRTITALCRDPCRINSPYVLEKEREASSRAPARKCESRTPDCHTTRRDCVLSLASYSLASLGAEGAAHAAELVSTRAGYEPSMSPSTELRDYNGSTYSISYPSNYTVSSKAGADVLFKDEERRGISIGITKLPVRISSVSEYGDIQGVGEKVLMTEKAKDGTLRAGMITSRAVDLNGIEGYEYEYEVVSTRGTKRILSRVAIKDKQLYVVNGTVSCGKVDACDSDELDAILPAMRRSVSSFRFLL